MTCDPHWTAYFSALLTPVIAILGSWIAFRQWRLGRNKLQLDLFDRRFSVYDGARGLLESVMTSAEAEDSTLIKFNAATREAKWLLSPTVAQYLDKTLYQKAVELRALQSKIQNTKPGEQRATFTQQEADLLMWFMAQYEVLDAHFAPFLRLANEA